MSTVRFESVSKQFTLHRHRSRSFQELFLSVLHPGRRSAKEKFWALRDVAFAAEPGEMLGFIGANGAGKSTVLKLISRIIEPTSGQIEINGRVGALLELGTGFHPDLTGRENIYLNGSIVGFGRKEIARLLDEIIGFSEMERFIDVPVKHYSSGMYMRLGFAIAIHIQPEILLVDEVLAVGDQAFQLRCLDRIREMRRQGVTIILVTHDLTRVRELCSRAIWLDDGMIRAEGVVDAVLEAYMTEVRADDKQALVKAESALQGPRSQAQAGTTWRWGTREGELVGVQFLDDTGEERRTFKTGDKFVVRIRFVAHERIVNPQFGLALYHANGFHINGPNSVFSGLEIEAIEGPGTIDYVVESLPLLEGSYLVSIGLYDHKGVHAYDHHHQVYVFRVSQNDAIQERYGSVLIPSSWHMGAAGEEA